MTVTLCFRAQAEEIRKILNGGPPTPGTDEAIEARAQLSRALEVWRRACERGEQAMFPIAVLSPSGDGSELRLTEAQYTDILALMRAEGSQRWEQGCERGVDWPLAPAQSLALRLDQRAEALGAGLSPSSVWAAISPSLAQWAGMRS